MRRLSRHLKIYIGLVSVLGLAVLALSYLMGPTESNFLTLSLAAAFSALIGLAGVYPLPVSSKIKANFVTAPAFAAVLLLSPDLAIAAAVTGVAASELVQKRKWHYVLFNASTASVYVGVSAILYSILRSGGNFFSWPAGVPAAATAAVAMYFLNRAAVAEAVAIQLKQSAIHIWLAQVKQDTLQELALFCLGFASALSIHLVTWSVLPLMLPVVIFYKVMAKVVTLSIKLESQMAELRATQAQLVQAAKIASLGTLTAGLGHQLNNPIFVIRGRAELLLDGGDRHLKTEKARHHLEVIHEMADRVARIVRCLLTSTRPSEDGRACAEVNDSLETSLGLFESKISAARVDVVRNYQPNLPLIPGDAVEIQELFGNLISNACDAMPDGGSLTITTRLAGQSVAVDVSDTGVGIPETNLAKIFDPFFTTKETCGGTGLGLYVVKSIADKYRGTIRVESKAGRGTTFHVGFPMADNYLRPTEKRHGERGSKVTVEV